MIPGCSVVDPEVFEEKITAGLQYPVGDQESVSQAHTVGKGQVRSRALQMNDRRRMAGQGAHHRSRSPERLCLRLYRLPLVALASPLASRLKV